jgi:hypothetical protein
MDSIEMVAAPFPETAPTEAAEEVLGKPDDFNTDTLAELYIGQGFYEKAIDIYQRMLADKPNSQGLKDKLERVRAMAVEAASGQAAPAGETEELTSTGEDIFTGAGMFEPSVAEEQAPIDAEVISEPMEPAGDGKKAEQTETNLFAQPEEAASFSESQEKGVDAEFFTEPSEYKPEIEITEKTGEGKPVIAPEAKEPASGEEEIVVEAEILSEPKELQPKTEAAEKKKEFGFFAEPREYRPAVDREETPPSRKESGVDLLSTPLSKESAQSEPISRAFESREYVPTKSDLKPVEAARVVEHAGKAPQPSKAAKKETIDRLETWLRNIKKEK